jgi:CelD/BcsL family acetyltransferase involved in cellulose biosynthesis
MNMWVGAMTEEVRDGFGARGAAPARVTVALEPGFDFLSSEYRKLFEASGATAFQHPVWLDTFYRTMTAPHGAEKLVVTGRDPATAALLFLLPLLRRRRSGVTVVEAAHLGVGDYAHPVVSPELRFRDFAPAVVAVLPRHDVVNIRPIRDEAVALWSAFLPGRRSRLDYSAHAAELSAPFAGWRDKAYEPSFAKYLDRKKRRFLKSGKVELLRVDRDFLGAIELIASIRTGRFEDDILQNGFAREFYADVAANGREFARIYQLKLDGADVAQAFGLVLGGRFYYVLIGADYERFGKHSPGLVLYDLLIEEWIKEGGAVFDFTISDEAFKRDFGTAATPMHALVEAATLKGRLALSAFDAMRGLRKWKAEARPAAVLRSMGETLRGAVVKTTVAAILVRPILAEFASLV